MKTTMKFQFAAVILLITALMSCNKEENQVTDPMSSPQLKSGIVFTISPSGNFNDDSYNIQTALNNAVAAGPGCTIKLTQGTFYLKYPVEIDNFDGFIVGAGKSETFLTTHDKIDFSSLTNGDMASLLKFRHGYVRMSDLTFRIDDPEPCVGLADNEWFQNALPVLIVVTGNATADPGTPDQNGSSSFNRINFIGGAGNLFGYNNGELLWIGSNGTHNLTGGHQSITACLFQSSVNSVSNYLDDNSSWIVGGSPNAGNVFKDGNWPLTMGEFSQSTAEISYNKFENIHWGAIFLSQGQFSDPSSLSLSTFSVQHNNIDITDMADGITVIDNVNNFDFGKALNAVISNNQISMLNAGYFGGIFGFGADDIILKSNKIWGDGIAGIYTGVNGDNTDRWFMQGNNVQNFTALAAPVWLGPGTSNYTVIGGSNKTNVFDQGVNNVLTGVSSIHGNDLGKQVKEAQALRQEIMKQFRNHDKK